MTKIDRNLFPAAIVGLSLLGFPFVASISSVLATSSTPLSIAMRAMIVFLSLLSLCFLRKHKGIFLDNILSFLLILFCTLYIIRITLYTIYPDNGARFELNHYLIWGLGTCLLPMAAIIFTSFTIDSEKIFKFVFLLGCIVIFVALVKAGTTFEVRGEIVDKGRLQLESLNPISLARVGAVQVVLSIWLITSNYISIRRPYILFFLVIVIFTGLYLVALSSSRGPMVSLLVAIFALFLSTSVTYKFRFLTVLVFVVIGVILLSPYADQVLLERALWRIEAAARAEDLSSIGRITAYKAAWGVFIENPIFGGAMEEPVHNAYPHNIVLESFMSTGLVGGLIFAIIIIVSFLLAVVQIKSKSADSWVSLIALFFLSQTQFSGALYQSPELWVSLALLVRVSQKSRVSMTKSVNRTNAGYHV